MTSGSQQTEQATGERQPTGQLLMRGAAIAAAVWIGVELGDSLEAKLLAALAADAVVAFLTAPVPGTIRRRRIVAVALVLALLRAGKAAAAGRRGRPLPQGPPIALLPASWAAVAAMAIVGLAGGVALSTATGSWSEDERPAATIAVPDVRGMARAAAVDRLRSAGLDVRARTAPSPSVPEGHVARTDPPPGRTADRGSAVLLLVSSGPRQVQVPAVRGMARAAAVARLAAAGLRVGRTRRARSGTVRRGRAIGTAPAAGATVRARTAVTLIVSSGPPRVTVPELAYEAEADALAALDGLRLEPAVERRPSDDVPSGATIGTAPPAGTVLRRGAAVTLIVSTGPDDDDVGPGGDVDCSDFATQADAQRYFEAHGGPAQDPAMLDGDRDGLACE
jgi:beta-lactam-binding protein with PASTA domain